MRRDLGEMISGWRVVRGLELAAYAACIAISFSNIPYGCSALWRQECLDNRNCRRFLRDGWLGPTLDVGDDQWRELRESLPILFAAITVHSLLSLLVRATCPEEDLQPAKPAAQPKPGGDSSRDGTAERNGDTKASPASLPPAFLPMGRLGRRRAAFNVAASVVFLGVMHGAHAVFPLALACGAFAVGHATKGTRVSQPAAWAVAIGFIWLKERWYRVFTFEGILGAWFAGLDGYRGIHPWRLSFNLAILRVVSFHVDLHWAEQQRRRVCSASAEQQTTKGGREARAGDQALDAYEYSSRVLAHRPPGEYSLWHCLSYVFYAPLYLAGPTLTFNAYVSQMACPQRSYGRGRLSFFLARLVFALLLLEWGLHKLPVFALARAGALNFRPEVLALFVYTILNIMWLKFLVIWRLFRFWALCDGVEPPENMQKCMSNNYSVANFWKGWHCSFNRWLVRYIYIPLGGSKPGNWWNVFVVFLFVALWHDVEAKLLMWGLLNGVFFMLEALIKGFYRRSGVFESCRANPLANRMVQGLGSTTNVMALLLVNLIGYTVGIKGTGRLVDSIFLDREGLVAVAGSFAVLFSGVQIMYAIENAKRRGDRSTTGYKKVAKL